MISLLSGIIRRPWVLWTATRWLRSRHQSRFLNFISTLSVLGILCGVMSLIIVMSVMKGFEGELKKRLMATDVHVLVTARAQQGLSSLGGGFREDGLFPSDSIVADLSILEVRYGLQLDSLIETDVLLRTGNRVAGVSFKGVSADRLGRLKVTEKADPRLLWVRDDSAPVLLPGVWLGREIAQDLQVIPGDRISIVSPVFSDGPLEAVPRMRRFVVQGIYESGLSEQESHVVFAPIRSVQEFMRAPGMVSALEGTVNDFDSAHEMKPELQKLMGDQFLVQDWQELNSSLFASFAMERVAMFVILGFMVIVASFNIITTLTLASLERTRETSVLRAMGAHSNHLRDLFLTQGLLLTGAGTFLGVLFAYVATNVLRTTEIIELPDIYYDRTLPVVQDVRYFLGAAAASLFIGLLAAWIPARRVVSQNLIRGIQGRSD